MTDDLGPTAKMLAHPKGSLTNMIGIEQTELVERLAKVVAGGDEDIYEWPHYRATAETYIAIVRAYDREQRDQLHERLAPKSDPDDTRDLPVAMTKPVTFKGGLTTDKR